jgi:chloramphenicol-sensitive protein RarD
VSTSATEREARQRLRLGLTLAVAAYGLWGIAPLYFRWLHDVPSVEIVAHRVFWSFVLLLVVVRLSGRWPELATVLRSPARLGRLGLTGILIGANWALFIWAIEQERVVAASLGYFVNPLLNVALGFALLGERLRPLQTAALALAVVGVALETRALGHLPLLSLALAGSFAFYGLVRKVWPEDPFVGLLLETVVLLPVAAVAVVWLQGLAELRADDSAGYLGALALAGVVTTAPLLCFAGAAPRLRLSTIGFTQYLAPSLQFLLAVFAFGEPFESARLVSFGIIWTALAVFTADALVAERRRPFFERPRGASS